MSLGSWEPSNWLFRELGIIIAPAPFDGTWSKISDYIMEGGFWDSKYIYIYIYMVPDNM